MKTAICYYSRHHGNTKKVLDAMAQGEKADLFDVTAGEAVDLEKYDLIGFASGIYFGKFHESVVDFARKHLPQGKKVFFVFTGGSPKQGNADGIKAAIADKAPVFLGEYFCRGYDTYGPFKLVGGIAKGRPNQEELEQAKQFYDSLTAEK